MDPITVGCDVNQAILNASSTDSYYGIIDEDSEIYSHSLETPSTEEIETNHEQVSQADDVEIAISKDDEQDIPLSESEESEEIARAPLSLSIENIQEGAKALQQVPQKHNAEIYGRIDAILDTPKEDYSHEKLEECIDTINEFSVSSELLVSSATSMATLHRLHEGQGLNKTQEIDKHVNGSGWEERAAKKFSYSKVTRCKYMRIGKIKGVEIYAFLGTEVLDKVARAIKATKVEGDDQIKELFDHFSVKCHMTLSHIEFKANLEQVLRLALNPDETSARNGDSGESKGNNTSGDGVVGNDNENDPSAEDADSSHNQNGESDASDNLDPVTDADESIDSAGDGSENTSEGSEESATEGKSSDSNTNDGIEEKAHRKLLNQDSLNIELTEVCESIDSLVETDISNEQFDIVLIDKLRTKLDLLEEHLNRNVNEN
ncbi:hypothetical protein KAJ27_02575 [bacterium]|nr:hypothetical protein [bacterium]